MELNFKILSDQPISLNFIKIGCNTFLEAAEYVRHLRYARNSDKNNPLCALEEFCGTCSTKHALLQRLAEENRQSEYKLMLGIFNMNSLNTAKIKTTLLKYDLKEIPEAHNYLKYKTQYLDVTSCGSAPANFLAELKVEIQIRPDQITDFKVEYHQNYIKRYLLKHPEITYSFQEFWRIREECISALSL